MSLLTVPEQKLELISWITQLPQDRVPELHKLLSPLFLPQTEEENEVWDEVREMIYNERKRSAQHMQAKMEALTWEEDE